MIRTLYRFLLWLHPPLFRRQFADEMLWIFDESADSQTELCFDGLVSLVRQWLLRSGSWKVAAALALASLQVTLGGFGMLLFGRRQLIAMATESARVTPATAGSLAQQPLTVAMVVYLAVFVVGGLSLLILGLSFWLKSFSGRRRPVAHRVR